MRYLYNIILPCLFVFFDDDGLYTEKKTITYDFKLRSGHIHTEIKQKYNEILNSVVGCFYFYSNNYIFMY